MANNLLLWKWVRQNQLSKSCLRRHRLFNYEPGLIAYQFGNYPTREPYYPNENDWKLLDLYAENGVGIINVREAWSDLSGYFGKDPQEPVNEQGFRRFVHECHERGLKVTPYISPGYMDIHSPVYRPEWSRGVGRLDEIYETLELLCPGSPGHRARFFSTIDRLMDSYGLDGFYWDGGMRLTQPGCFNENHDGHVHFWETTPAAEDSERNHAAGDAAVREGFAALWNDFICEVYARIKRRNGIVVAHISSDLEPPFEDKCWDYLLVGEGIGDPIASVEKTKRFEPYVLRFNDWSTLITNYRERDLTPKLELVPKYVHLSMALCIPYLQ
ncbi:MAG: hypothetical protein HY318_15345, partial [Armatimonadetes bacterium]|nr:hypothetical protein [Armatimonadota bacterium]